MKKGKHSFLTPYRLEKLEQVGFSWQIRTALDGDDDVGPEPAARGEASEAAPAAGDTVASVAPKEEPPTGDPSGSPPEDPLAAEAAATAAAVEAAHELTAAVATGVEATEPTTAEEEKPLSQEAVYV